MEGPRVRVALIVCLMLGMLVTESAAAFSPLCYAKCFFMCLIRRRNPILCGTLCVVKCLVSGGDKDKECYERVVDKCLSEGRSKEDCANEAEQQCKRANMLAESDPSYLCQYGCATNICAKISTAYNPGSPLSLSLSLSLSCAPSLSPLSFVFLMSLNIFLIFIYQLRSKYLNAWTIAGRCAPRSECVENCSTMCDKNNWSP